MEKSELTLKSIVSTLGIIIGLLAIPFSAYGTECLWTLSIPNFSNPITSSANLEGALSEVENQWILSRPIADPMVIIESLEDYTTQNNQTKIHLNTRSLFESLHRRNIKFLPPPFPKILLIIFDCEDQLLSDSEFHNFLQKISFPDSLAVCTPLWDLEEYKNLDPRELKGYLSEDYISLLGRYDANFLVLIHCDPLRSLWDVRIVNPMREDVIRDRAFSHRSIRQNIYDAILKSYYLEKNYFHQALCLPRGSLGTLIEQYIDLSQTAEIQYPVLRIANRTRVKYDVITNWSPELLELIQKKKSSL